jgi:hypothetical protein
MVSVSDNCSVGLRRLFQMTMTSILRGILYSQTDAITMVRQARALIREGAIGRVRLIEAELSVGDPGVVAEPKDPSQRHWRFRKSSMGEGAILGEVGTSIQYGMFCVRP